MNDSWAISHLVSEIKQKWRRTGEAPDAEAVLAAHPHLRRWKSIVLDLAFEEFQLRKEGGQSVGAAEFCRRFPDYQRSLLHRIEVEEYLRQEEQQLARLWPQPGERFLGYRLLEQLGKGAVGCVFLAQQIAMRDRLVVVKITPRGQHEADTLAMLSHPHVVPVYRYDEDPQTGLAAICMPYLSRATLEDLLAARLVSPGRDFPSLLQDVRRRFPADEATIAASSDRRPPTSYLEGVLDLGRQMADALAHTHQRGVLHLDLKPSNVLLLADGRPMLLDFNLSVEGVIGTSIIGGTLPYMSPEQLQETILGRSYSSRPVDGRSDVFSLGVMLYELLADRSPFGEIPRTRDPREAAKELLRRHERGPAPWQGNPSPDREVVRFLDACLAFHPDHRPQTAKEAAAELARLLRPMARLRRWSRSYRRGVSAIGGLVVAAAISSTAMLAPAPLESERLRRAAESHVVQEDWNEPELLLRQSLDDDDRSAGAWELLGQSYAGQGRYREAFESFQRAHELSGDPRLLAAMGDAKFADRQFELAAIWYERAIAGGYEGADLQTRLEQMQSRVNKPAAEVYLSTTIDHAPEPLELRTARLRVAVGQAISSGLPIDEAALPDADAVRGSKTSTGKDLFAAAMAYCSSSNPETYEAQVRDCLTRGRQRGLTPGQLGISLFSDVFGQAEWYQMLRKGDVESPQAFRSSSVTPIGLVREKSLENFSDFGVQTRP